MGWADNLASRSSHRSAQSYKSRSTGSVERVLNEKQRRQEATDAWGVRYGQEIGGVRQAGQEGGDAASQYIHDITGDSPDFAELSRMKPGTPEFCRRYIPPAEPCETLAPHGPEGFAVISVDDVPLETPEPIKIGWGELR